MIRLALVVFLGISSAAHGDTFDRYVNPVLAAALEAEGVQERKQLTLDAIASGDRALPGTTGAFLIVKTNDGRNSKLLVQAARQKTRGGVAIPVLLLERYVTYREGQERTVQASGQNVSLFAGFHFNLDLGQVVPPELGGDLRFVSEAGKAFVEPVGKAKLYLVTKPLPLAAPKKTARFEAGETFEPRFFTGTYKLHDDGRRSGTLTLKAADDGDVSGSYYSDKDGQKYEVEGKIGTPKHSVQFTIRFPRSRQTFQGWLFTGDGKALVGTSRLLDRETGFYALRVEEE